MKLLRFILGVLGILLIIGAFSSFIPLFFIGGLATGSALVAFGLPIFLMILGAAMVYFGFYYSGENQTHSNLIWIIKWGIIYTISILLSNYILARLVIVNTLLVTLITALLVSIVAHAVRSHEEDAVFRARWFIFYFLLYANIIWLMSEVIVPMFAFETSFFTSLVVGFTIAGLVAIVQKLNIRRNTAQWVVIILALILLVANLESMRGSPLDEVLDITTTNSSALSESSRECPKPIISAPLIRTEQNMNAANIGPTINGLIDTSVWKIEGNLRTCYKGKYAGQYPTWFYCDDMIVSRWETSQSGTIRYRWYTAISAIWQPKADNSNQYVFNSLMCEGGKKVTVNKDTTSYYVHVSRDGTEIKVEY